MIYKKSVDTFVWRHRRLGSYLAKRNLDKRISGDNLQWLCNIHAAYLSENVPTFIEKIADKIPVTVTTEIKINSEINNG